MFAFLWASSAVAAGKRVTYPYFDDTYLAPGESKGAAVFVPAQLAHPKKAPLVVFLHGNNPEGVLHKEFGAYGQTDLSAVAENLVASGTSRPFIIAAPSQTRHADAGKRLWQDFDLDSFVDVTEQQLGGSGSIARDQVYVIGHSGAGCNPDGGLLRAATHSRNAPRAVIAVDTCLDGDSGQAIGLANPNTTVWIRWQHGTWMRPVEQFASAYARSARQSGRMWLRMEEVHGLGTDAHMAILLDTFTSALPTLLPPPAQAPQAKPHMQLATSVRSAK